ncbi:LOW QUALITY PROTEIN: kynurenine--oxoglutarate transaminase 1-like [Ctenodactylus gundi]
MAKRLQARRLDGIDHNPWVKCVKLTNEYDTVNLGQGFPNFPPPDFAVEAFQQAVSGDFMLNQYTRAFSTVDEALVDEGDKAITRVTLDPTELASKFTSCTKALVLNTPNNPLGKVFSKAELELAASLCQQHNVLCFSDEVYQWLVYDGHQHISIASLPSMWERTLTIGSAGKAFGATGWKVGWVLGPDDILKHLRTVHQNSVYHCPTQAQTAVAQCFEWEQLHLGQASSYFTQLSQASQHRWDHMVRSLQSVGLKPFIPQGSYFLIADISDFQSKMPDLPGAAREPYDRRFVKWMIKNKGLATILVSNFYSGPHQEFDYCIWLCFVKEEVTLQAMDKKLQQWKSELNL